MKDFRMTALAISAIGFFILLGSAGASDRNAPMSQVMTLIAIGASIIAISLGYIYIYEKFAEE